MSEPRRRPKIVERLLAGRERHVRRPKPVRVAFALAGFIVLAGGVIMLVTPGPAFVLIPIGLSILALEFTWAERLLERSLVHAAAAQEKAANARAWQKVLGVLAVLLAAGALVAAYLVWIR